MKVRNSSNYSVLSLFTGAGGLDLGFELEGFKLIEGIDIDPWCIKTLKENRPHWNVISGDVCSYNPQIKQQPDVLLAGVPCQGFSLGGNRNNYDTRNLLYKEVIRIAKICQPRVIVIENVLNLRTMKTPDTGRPFAQQVAADLEQLGYEVLSDIFKVCYYGVPQTRRRFVFVAFLGGRPSRYFLPRPDSETTIREFLYDLAQSRVTNLPNHQPEWGFKSAVHIETGQPFVPGEEIVPVRLSRTASDGNPIRSFDAPFPAIDTATIWGWAQGNVVAARHHKDRLNGKFVRNPEADVTLWRVSASRLRSFTHREYARLQTFPDDWVFIGGNKRDIHLQIGNAVPVRFAQQIARNIRIALESLDQNLAFFDEMATGNLLLF
ncbi:DNA (cytosine-5-)-methyltransferase [Microcoleus sp. FACHB-68]|uniref:DNA (cytosine-5-)-methyltransferase n=1 Tax=Microcoleus sp. FACHB-68 TaxID=2692826 RepID=UPI0016879639|nr:DNA (cytosine-5-)-methyltransferase [Microcoleus sp. FACHB-68]